MRKNIVIEFYRFIISLSVAWFHFNKIWANNNNWRLGVEFFFILSGFLLMNHCDRKKDETVWQVTWEKIKTFYPYYGVMFLFGVIAETMIKGNNIIINSYQHLHQLLFLTDWFREKVSYFSGTEQLWFITTQLWMIPLLTYFIKKHKDLYISLLAPIFLIVGYTVVIRNSGNLNANLYVTINEKDIWFPLQFLRALAGLACGTLVYTLYVKLKLYHYTDIAKKFGLVSSVCILFFTLWLSYRAKDLRINSYNWRTLLIVILYAAAILLAFLFGSDFKFEKNVFNRLFIFLGKCSLPVYMVHTLVIYVMKNTLEMSCLQKKVYSNFCNRYCYYVCCI